MCYLLVLLKCDNLPSTTSALHRSSIEMAEAELNTTSSRTDGSISGEAMQPRSISSLPAGFSMAYPVMFHP